jgi:hypothetical protein
VLEPVLGDVTVNEGIGYDAGKAEDENQPQQYGSGRKDQEKSQISANQFAHEANIARFPSIAFIYLPAFSASNLLGLTLLQPPARMFLAWVLGHGTTGFL